MYFSFLLDRGLGHLINCYLYNHNEPFAGLDMKFQSHFLNRDIEWESAFIVGWRAWKKSCRFAILKKIAILESQSISASYLQRDSRECGMVLAKIEGTGGLMTPNAINLVTQFFHFRSFFLHNQLTSVRILKLAFRKPCFKNRISFGRQKLDKNKKTESLSLLDFCSTFRMSNQKIRICSQILCYLVTSTTGGASKIK